jgi:YgiT-type zinc finger domain-containing protein
MKCMYCSGEMKQGTAPFHVDRHGFHLVMDAIPAWVCSQCGEEYFERTEVDLIQNVIRAIDEQSLPLRKTA